MLLNATTAISTSSLLLVPYSKWHVPRYHDWMQDEEIQAATASEPLTIEEEYSMQQSWRKDADKLTFIICLPTPAQGGEAQLTEADDAPDRMVGDINLFLRVDDCEEGEEGEPIIIGEVELMIAEKKDQRRGFGRAALLAFLRYITAHQKGILEEFVANDEVASERIVKRSLSGPLKLVCLSVKIGQGNEGSLALFESVGFKRVSEEPNYFGEFELRKTDLGHEGVEDAMEKAGIRGYTELPYLRQQ